MGQPPPIVPGHHLVKPPKRRATKENYARSAPSTCVRSAGERSSSYSFLRRSLLGFYEAKIMKLHFVHRICVLPSSRPLTHSLTQSLVLSVPSAGCAGSLFPSAIMRAAVPAISTADFHDDCWYARWDSHSAWARLNAGNSLARASLSRLMRDDFVFWFSCSISIHFDIARYRDWSLPVSSEINSHSIGPDLNFHRSRININ